MPKFHIEWTIQLNAETAQDAAREALRIQRDPTSLATVFYVMDEDRPWDEEEEIDVRDLP